jgi:hypothetical protein
MLIRFFHASLLILLTTAIHGATTTALASLTDRFANRLRAGKLLGFRSIFVPLLVLAMLMVSLFEACIWAWYYWVTGQLTSFMESVYFSLITMTTVGYGDVTLGGSGRVTSGMQAALGIVLFGWTTAIIFMAVQTVHIRPKESSPRSS